MSSLHGRLRRCDYETARLVYRAVSSWGVLLRFCRFRATRQEAVRAKVRTYSFFGWAFMAESISVFFPREIHAFIMAIARILDEPSCYNTCGDAPGHGF